MGTAILDRKSWGPPSWTGSDVKNAKVAPILLLKSEYQDRISKIVILNSEIEYQNPKIEQTSEIEY